MSAVKSPPEELSAQKNGKGNKIVVEKAEAEEFPPGWTKEVKIRKSGSKTKTDRYYTDPVTGYTFRSLKDVQRYLKTGEVGKLAIKPKDDSCVNMDVEDEKLHTQAGGDEHELPDRVTDDQMAGQQSSSLVEMKTDESFVESTSIEDDRRVSANASEPSGKKIVELSDVNIPAAIGLEEREENSELKEQMIVPSPLSETSSHKRPLENDSEGPRKRSKSSEKSKSESPLRASKRLAGMKIDAPPPSPSLPEPKTRQATRLAGIKIDASPPLLREPKTRQATRLAGIKIDAPPPSPTEPKTRQATRLAGIEIGASPSSLPEPKSRQATRLAGIKVDASPPSEPEPKTRQATRLAGIKIDASPLSPPEPKTRQATRLAGIKVDASPPSLPEPKTRQGTRLAGIKVEVSPPSLPEPKTRQATRLAGIKIDAPPPSPPEPKTRRPATARQAREAETSTIVSLASPKESSKKAEVEKSTCHGMQVDPTALSEVRLSTPVECVREVADKLDGNADMDNKPNLKQEISIPLPLVSQESCGKVNEDDFKADEKQELCIVLPPVTPSTPREHYKEIEMEPTALLAGSQTTPEVQALPTVVPPVNLENETDDKPREKQELPVVTPLVSNPISQDSHGGETALIKPESPVNFSVNDLWTDPCIEFAVKTLTGAIPFGDLNKADSFAASPLEVPLEELWTDPCIEFAVKTLTGAIPVGEDLFQDYLQHQPTSSSEKHSFSLPDVGVNNFCQTEVLSKHFETAAHNKQQDSVVPALRNGGLQNSGNTVLPQQVKGSNGQCSRPRFFQ